MENNSKTISHFFLKLALIAFVIFVCDRITGVSLRYLYFSQKHGTGYLTTYQIDSTKARILVFGSSRANHSYVPGIFEKELNLSFYNAGRDGAYILHNYAIFKAITKRYAPDLIIFDIRPEEFKYNVKEYEMLSLLLPYSQHPEIMEVADLKGPFERLKRMSAVYPYNSLIFQIIMGNIEKGKDRDKSEKGYVPLSRKMESEIIDTANYDDFSMDMNKVNALLDISNTCRQSNISLLIVQSPLWRMPQSCPEWSRFVESNALTYIDMSGSQTFISNPQYFSDRFHLNNEGAQVFSTMLATFLKTNYSDKIVRE